MKRGLIICFLLAFVAACNEDKVSEVVTTTCGNGVLDNNEPCDGELFASDLNLVCDNGIKPAASKLRCTSSCAVDLADACTARCGNDTIDPGEECDGRNLPQVSTPCENADLSKLRCQACKLVDDGICGASQSDEDKCGNDALDKGELCDGTRFSADAKTCPRGMEISDASKFKCMSSCNLVDISQACVPTENKCGNGVLDDDEMCDGKAIDENIEFESCPLGYVANPDALKCTASCELDTSKYCEIACGNGKIDEGEQCDEEAFVTPVPSDFCPVNYLPTNVLECNHLCKINPLKYCTPDTSVDNLIVLSEVVPIVSNENGKAIDAVAFEYTNLSDNDADLSQCSLHVYYANGSSVVEYPLADLGISGIKSRESIVICSQNKDYFEGVCNYTVSEKLAQDFIFSFGLMALECNGEFVDLLNLNSLLQAIAKGDASDFVRHCNHGPVSAPSEAAFGDNWLITALTLGAPKFGLGEHCVNADSEVESCTYTVDRTTLNARDQVIHQTLDIKIPGITTISDHTDAEAAKSVIIRFVTGKLSDDGKVAKSNIHFIGATADESWVNANGIDRYIGELRNYDTYEGFISGDEGSYVLDAAISFDNEQSWIYCGPKGRISKYKDFNAEERNRLDVSYEPSNCGDGQITGVEVCDGDHYIEGALVCANDGYVVTDRSKLKCSNCNYINTNAACSPKH